MNYRIRSGLSQHPRSGQNLGASAAASDKWDKTLVDIYTGENRGKYRGEFDSDIVYLSGFSSSLLEDLNSWREDLQIIIEAMVDHAAGSQLDATRFEEWISRDFTPIIDAEHEDSLGIYVPLLAPKRFSFSGPSRSTEDGITDTAPAYTIFPEHFLSQFPRFKGRILFSCQAMLQETGIDLVKSGNIGAIRGFPADQYNGGALTSATLNLMLQHMQGSTSACTWILLKIVQTRRRTREIFGIVKSYADSDQRIEDRKALNLEMSIPTLFHMTPLLMLLAPDLSSARHAASSLILPSSQLSLRIEHWPRGQNAREMMQMLSQDSRVDSLLAVKMIWIHREMMTTRADVTHSPGDTLYLFIPDGLRPEGVFCGEAVNSGRGRTREILGPTQIPAYTALRRQLLEEQAPVSRSPQPAPPGKTGRATRGTDKVGPGRTSGKGNLVPRLPNLSPITAGGFTLVKSKATLKTERKPATWGGQSVALPTLLGIPSLIKTKSSLVFAPPPPAKIRVPTGVRSELSLAEYPELPHPLKSDTLSTTPPQWRILQFNPAALVDARDRAEPETDDDGILAPGLMGRCLSLGIIDAGGASMAYWAARTQILLLGELYPDWSLPDIPLNMEFLLESKLLAPKLSGAQRIIRLSPIEDSLSANCALWGAQTPGQVQAVLVVLQEQYGALRLHLADAASLIGLVPPAPIDYVPHVLRLPGSELMRLASGLLPVKPNVDPPLDDQLLGDALDVPTKLQQALRILICYLIADATKVGLPPGGMRVGEKSFQYEPIPWADLAFGMPPAEQWVVIPQVQQQLMAFKAYDSASQSILLRALSIVERAIHWSRAKEGLETRGAYLYAAHSGTALSNSSTLKPPAVHAFPGLETLCDQHALDIKDLIQSMHSFPEVWSEIATILTNWVTSPEYLPWNVWNNPPLFQLFLASELRDEAEDIYSSMIQQPTLWATALHSLTSLTSWRKEVEHGQPPPDRHRDALKQLLGDIALFTADFILITMTQRAAYWRRAIMAIREFNQIPTSTTIARSLSLALLHNMWALGVHKLETIHSFLKYSLTVVDNLAILLDFITQGEPVVTAPTILEEDLQLGGSLPAGEYYLYLPPDPEDNAKRAEALNSVGTIAMTNV